MKTFQEFNESTTIINKAHKFMDDYFKQNPNSNISDEDFIKILINNFAMLSNRDAEDIIALRFDE